MNINKKRRLVEVIEIENRWSFSMSWGRMHMMEKWLGLQAGVMRYVLEVNKAMCVLRTVT